MIAYHGNPELKEQFVRLIRQHRDADEIAQRTYFSDDGGTVRMCAVGCSIESLRTITGRRDILHDDHAAYEELIGVPRILARLENGIFEGLPIEQATAWPARFAAAIRVGADLSLVWPRFAVWLLTDTEHGVIRFAKTDRQRAAIQAVSDLYQRTVNGETIAQSDWRAAADAYAAYSTRQHARIAQADRLIALLEAA